MSSISRRTILASGSATLAMPFLIAPAVAQPTALVEVTAGASRLDQIHALVIHQNGNRVFAEAFRGRALDRPANVKSVSKTIVALLTGIAIDRGVVASTDQRILPMLGRAPFGDARDEMTVADLLTMRAGLSSTSGADYGAWVSSRDWVEYALNQPLEGAPGGRFIYSTGGWHVLGAALARVSGQSLLQLAQAWLGNPLDIAIPPWVADPQGRYLGGNDMAISPLGLARIGDMVLNGGQLGGQRVVSESWLNRSFEARARSPFSGDQYGYGWFLTRFGGQASAYARGYGGQMLVVVPRRGLSIAITSDPARPARSDGYFGDLRRLVDDIVRVV
ncbi:serine hydrolase [Paracoccus sp. SCSIO 75233]|uniref:serine hydrolase domain-containing protein n=1 Tax=Paracoccus sp. SCSIO 75233 TaxID=3017782 RepID=UPI0022F142B3|nr:serine hydrolase [Paracoccus sp. SCSIO 75233]WBU53588.1 serine hydrolase [Paracoccus sp. SCSIO 75233]